MYITDLRRIILDPLEVDWYARDVADVVRECGALASTRKRFGTNPSLACISANIRLTLPGGCCESTGWMRSAVWCHSFFSPAERSQDE